MYIYIMFSIKREHIRFPFCKELSLSGGVAQLVEQRTENPCVTGSIPVLATIFVSTPVKPTGFFVFSPTTYPQKTLCGVSGKL